MRHVTRKLADLLQRQTQSKAAKHPVVPPQDELDALIDEEAKGGLVRGFADRFAPAPRYGEDVYGIYMIEGKRVTHEEWARLRGGISPSAADKEMRTKVDEIALMHGRQFGKSMLPAQVNALSRAGEKMRIAISSAGISSAGISSKSSKASSVTDDFNDAMRSFAAGGVVRAPAASARAATHVVRGFATGMERDFPRVAAEARHRYGGLHSTARGKLHDLLRVSLDVLKVGEWTGMQVMGIPGSNLEDFVEEIHVTYFDHARRLVERAEGALGELELDEVEQLQDARVGSW